MDKATKKKRMDVLRDSDAYQNSSSTTQHGAVKRAKITNNNNMLTLLDENSLLQVLLRTRCEDHNALRQTCRRFQSIIDSDLFIQQRAQQEWAQVETHLLTADAKFTDDDYPGYDYMEDSSTFRNKFNDLGYQYFDGAAIKNAFHVLVDGKVGGSGRFTLIQRNNKQMDFYSAMPMEEVHETGSLFFDNKGRPRLPSVKDAIQQSTTSNNNTMGSGSSSTIRSTVQQKKDYFLYLDRFQLNPEYRLNNTTFVGAQAIRSLLLDSPLKDQWSVAIYIADVTAQQTEQDQVRARRQEMLEQNRFRATFVVMGRDEEERRKQYENEQALQESNNWMERSRSLTKADLYQFIRCGFQQTTDSFQKSRHLYATALPSFLSDPMLSHKEALAVNIVDRKDLSPGIDSYEMSTVDTRLSKFMIHACTRRQEMVEMITYQESSSLPTREQVTRQLETDFSRMGSRADAAEQNVEQIRRGHVAAMAALDRERTRIVELKGLSSQVSSTHIEMLNEARRNEYQGFMEELQQREETVESRSDRLKEEMSTNEEHLRAIAATKAELESLQSRKNVVIEEEMQLQLSAHAGKLTKARTELTSHDMDVKAEVAKLVGEQNNNNGAAAVASVKNSGALHACAANMIPEYIDLLLEFTPPAERHYALNMLDDANGLTPLMVAAIATTHFSNSNSTEMRIEMTEKLIALGANKNIADVFGETALGKFRGMRRTADANFGRNLFAWRLQPTQSDLDRERVRMEQLLRPIGGPTAADDSYLSDASNDIEN